MSAAAAMLFSLREQVLGLFPALSRLSVRKQKDGGAFAIGAASERVEVAGPQGLLPAARQTDLVVRLFQNTTTGIVFASTSASSPYVWAPIASGTLPPTIADAGTVVAIVGGSTKVKVG